MSIQVYEQIEKLCKKKGIAITRLESELGFGRGSIGKMKKGGSSSAERLQKIADYFGVPITTLTSGTIVIDPAPYRKIAQRALEEQAEGLSEVVSMYTAFNDQDRQEILALMRSKMAKYKVEKKDASLS